MTTLETWHFSTHRYAVDVEIYNNESGETYVKVQAHDWHPDPGQKWAGLMREYSEAEFCQLMWRELERRQQASDSPYPQEANQ